MKYYVTIGGRTHEVDMTDGRILLNGREVSADLRELPGAREYSAIVDGRSVALVARRNGAGDWRFQVNGRALTADVTDERTRTIRAISGAAAANKGPASVRAPMPGMVVKVMVEEGDHVDAGQGVVVVEAMKMENELRVEGPATVTAVRVRPGEAVEKDQILIDLETPTEGS